MRYNFAFTSFDWTMRGHRIFNGGGGAPFWLNNPNDNSDSVAVQNTAYANDNPTGYNSNFGALAHGSTYTFTDSSKISGYRSGSQTTDLTTITVNNQSDHGSQTNPFVIDSVAKWTNFATFTTANNSNTLNKYFVLTVDLTFSNNFKPINYFRGAFYGLNHTLNGVTGSSTGEALGVFCYLNGLGTVTDLSVNYTWTQTANYTGGIVGTALGNDCYILNCHSIGTATRTTRNVELMLGGILGRCGETGLASLPSSYYSTTVYRCSTKSTFTVTENSTNTVFLGGLIGRANNNSLLNLFDCYSEANYTLTCNGSPSIAGIIGGIANPGRSIVIENIVGKCNVGSVNNVKGYSEPKILIASLFNYTSAVFKNNMTISNTYTHTYGVGGTQTKYARPVVYTDGSQTGVSGGGASNLNIASYGSGPFFSALDTTNPTAGRFLPGYAKPGDSRNTVHSSTTALWTAAKNSTALQTKIWTNKSAISDSYIYSFATSPVRNTAIKTRDFSVNYYNRKNNADEAVSGATSITYNPSSATTTLASPVMTERSFAGWTSDVSGNSSPFTSLSSGQNFYGDIKLYAVWDALNAYSGTSAVSAAITAKSESTIREEDNKYSVDYGSTLQLTGSIDYLPMTDEVVTYRWVKASEEKSSNASLNLSQVSDSGVYQLQYKVKSAQEPLWRSPNWMVAAEREAEIKGADVKLKRFSLGSGVKAYIGMPLGDLVCTVEIADEGGRDVAGTYEWEGGANATIEEDKVYEDANGTLKYKKNLILKPTGGNYGNTTVEVEFEVEYLNIVFNMEGVEKPLKLLATYGQNYTNGQIAYEFEQAFLKELEENGGAYTLVKDKVPYFDGVIISEFREKEVNNEIKSTMTIAVTFRDVEYTVTFKYTDADGAQEKTEKYKYGQNLKNPTFVNLPSGHLIFGWNFESKDGEGNSVTRYWNFVATEDAPIDCVTGDVTLTADMREVTLTLLRLEVVQHNKTFEALSKLTAKDVTVYAIYDIQPKVEGMDEYRQALAEGEDGYKVDYHNAPENCFVYDPSGDHSQQVTLLYEYNGVTKDFELDCTVYQKNISTADLFDSEYTFNYDGNAKRIPTPSRLPDGITGVSYKYYRSGSSAEITDLSTLTGDPDSTVRYNVVISFTVENQNYRATDRTVQMIIYPQAVAVEIEWDSLEVEYTGSVVYPTAKAKRVSDGQELNIQLQFDTSANSVEPIAVGSGYTVTAISVSAEYRITAGASVTYSITQAKLALPEIRKKYTYNGKVQDVTADIIGYDASKMSISGDSSATNARDYIIYIDITDDNYIFADGSDSVELNWSIAKKQLRATWSDIKLFENSSAQYPTILSITGFENGDSADLDNDFSYIGDTGQSAAGSYAVTAVVNGLALWKDNYEIKNLTRTFAILPIGSANVNLIEIEWDETTLVYTGSILHPTAKVVDENGNEVSGVTLIYGGDYYSSKWAGSYKVTVSVGNTSYFILSGSECDYVITPDPETGEGVKPSDTTPTKTVISVNWDSSVKPPRLVLTALQKEVVEYLFYDEQGNEVTFDEIGVGAYTVKARIKQAYSNLYEFDGNVDITDGLEFEVVDGDELKDPNAPADSETPKDDDKNGGNGFALPKDFPLWQLIVSAVAIIFIIIFASKLLNYSSRNKKAKRALKKRDNSVFALLPVFSTTEVLFGLSNMVYSIIAFALLAIMVVLFILMMIMRGKCLKSEEQAEDAKDEDMKMMLMRMMSGNGAQGAYMNAQSGIGAEEVRGTVADTVTALLPGMQQLLPQQASTNDEVVQKLIEQNEMLMQKLADQSAEKVVEREVAVASVDDEAIKELIEKNDQNIQKLMDENSERIERLMDKIMSFTANGGETQVVEKVVEVPVEIEKIVEKEVKVETPVEKVVEKIVRVPAGGSPKREKTPRLTLDEAYARLNKQQKRFFDQLREYALSKEKSKEKKAIYSLTIGQSSVNPYIKLTIKKDTTVALFKMEDEYLKDIRRNAGSDGTKVKVKETEVLIADEQAFQTAKDMVDLRLDQIDRYNDLLKEQRAMKRK